MTQSHVLNFGNHRYEVEVGRHADRASGSALLRSDDVHLLAVIDVQSSSRVVAFQLSTDYRARSSTIG